MRRNARNLLMSWALHPVGKENAPVLAGAFCILYCALGLAGFGCQCIATAHG